MARRLHSGEPVHVRQDPWIEQLAWLMDSSIGIGRYSIGVESLLGFVPGLGDAAGAVISMLIVQRAVRAGVPRVAVARMMANIAIDSLLGTVPLIGDLFDLGFKANVRNVRIYNEYIDAARVTNVRHWLFFAALAALVLAIAAVPVVLLAAVLRAVSG